MPRGDTVHGYEREAKVARLADQAIQRGLISKAARDRCAAIGIVGDRELIEPCRPIKVEMRFDTDLVVA